MLGRRRKLLGSIRRKAVFSRFESIFVELASLGLGIDVLHADAVVANAVEGTDLVRVDAAGRVLVSEVMLVLGDDGRRLISFAAEGHV